MVTPTGFIKPVELSQYSGIPHIETKHCAFLKVHENKDTHLRNDTAKCLCSYIKITANLQKK